MSAFERWLPRRTWPLALLAAAVLAVPLLSRREMRFPPSAVLAWALAAAVVASLLGRARLWRRIDPLLAVAVGAAAMAQQFLPGIVFGHDAKDHVWGAWGYLQAWRAGDWLPIWLHHLGPGMPMPLFYGPLGFWAMAPAALAGRGPGGMYAASFVLASVTAALLARHAVLGWTQDRRAALVAAVAFAFAPYRLLDANYRSGLGETWAVALVPLALYGFERLVTRGSRRDFALAALAAALVALAHPISLIMLAFLLPVLWGRTALAGAQPPPRAAGRAAIALGAALCGLLLSGAFTIPLLAEKQYLSLADSILPAEDYSATAAFPSQLVDRQLWDTLRWSHALQPDGSQSAEDMPFYAGIVALTALGTAALLRGRRSRAARVASALGALGVMATAAATFPAARWIGAIPGIAILQFPWRFLGPASAAAALAGGLLVARARGARLARPLAAVAALAFLADGFAYSGAVRRLPAWQGLALYEFSDPNLGSMTALPPPWPLRVVGNFVPPDLDAPVGYLAEAIDHRITPPYREDLTPAVHAFIQSGAWPQLAVGGVGSAARELRHLRLLPYARFRARATGTERAVAFERAAGRIAVRTPPSGGTIVVAEQYFPGWRIRTPSGWREANAGPQGLLQAEVPRGVRSVEWRFDRWRADRLAGWIASGATALFLLALVLGPRRRRFAPD